MSRMRAAIRDSGLSWMRVAIAVGVVALLAGVAGMVVWINDGSDYFDIAVALASAGFLTLVACVLSRVFGASHGSQDDAFRRGRSMGYDAGFIEGRRTSRPVVVPLLHAVGRDQEIPAEDTDFDDDERVEQARFTPAILPVWRRQEQEQEQELDKVVGWDRLVSWMGATRIPLLAGALSLALVAAMVGVAMARPLAPVQALQRFAGSLLDQTDPSPGGVSALLGRTADSRASDAVADVANSSPLALPDAARSPREPAASGLSPMAVTNAVLSPVRPIVILNSAAVLASVPISAPGLAGVGEATSGIPAVSAPVVAAPVATLTAAEKTAADALAAANLTASNAAHDAAKTAADAKDAADLTAANAARDAAKTAADAKDAADLTAANAARDAAKTAADAKAAADLTAANAARDAALTAANAARDAAQTAANALAAANLTAANAARDAELTAADALAAANSTAANAQAAANLTAANASAAAALTAANAAAAAAATAQAAEDAALAVANP